MKHLAKLFKDIDRTNSINAKVKSLVEYFEVADEKDIIWTIALFTHKRPKRSVKTTLLREWAAEIAGIPLWLFEESYHIVGDLAETISLILDSDSQASDRSLSSLMVDLINLKELEEAEKKKYITSMWREMNKDERFLFNKFITGGFRVGISTKTIVKALAKVTGQEANVISHRLMGNWDPRETDFDTLIRSQSTLDHISKPYPFYLAYGLESEVSVLGPPTDWIAERKWDGIRGQIIIRQGEVFVWSRGEELITDKFPEFQVLGDIIQEDVVLDGEILVFKDGIPQAFNEIQTRIGRKNISKKLLQSSPVVMICYDLLEYVGRDIRQETTEQRRNKLNMFLEKNSHVECLCWSEEVTFVDWQELTKQRDRSREYHCEGLMLKHRHAPYGVGRKKGDWWKWKVDPMTVDAVMIYAQRGHGRRANLYTDFTFAIWNDDQELVPFAKAYTGLTDVEFKEITAYVKKNTIQKFGPVCSVNAELVFELAFEGIALSPRHKSGIALRFPRILRWRKDKKVNEIGTLKEMKEKIQ